jgi:hypothetical protein
MVFTFSLRKNIHVFLSLFLSLSDVFLTTKNLTEALQLSARATTTGASLPCFAGCSALLGSVKKKVATLMPRHIDVQVTMGMNGAAVGTWSLDEYASGVQVMEKIRRSNPEKFTRQGTKLRLLMGEKIVSPLQAPIFSPDEVATLTENNHETPSVQLQVVVTEELSEIEEMALDQYSDAEAKWLSAGASDARSSRPMPLHEPTGPLLMEWLSRLMEGLERQHPAVNFRMNILVGDKGITRYSRYY